MIPFMGETVCRAFNFVFIPVFSLLLYIYIYVSSGRINQNKIRKLKLNFGVPKTVVLKLCAAKL